MYIDTDMDKNTDGEDTNKDSNMDMDRHGQDMDAGHLYIFCISKSAIRGGWQ
jgi:hypothetical protein